MDGWMLTTDGLCVQRRPRWHESVFASSHRILFDSVLMADGEYSWGWMRYWIMNGKVLVVGIAVFFLLFFVVESWLMRGLPH
jgi:hypothetical protein